jgi:hypothetical protein
LVYYILTTAAISSLGVGALVMERPLMVGQADTVETSHRGSGRLITEAKGSGDSMAYRGTGRYQNYNVHGVAIAHRGSGRTPIDGYNEAISYRGTGRFVESASVPKAG